MAHEEIQRALEQLRDFDLPTRHFDRGPQRVIRGRHRVKASIEHAVNLAASFARALETARADGELKRRAALFEDLVAPGSSFDDARRTALGRVSRAIEEFKLPDGSFPARSPVMPRAKITLIGTGRRPAGWELIASDQRKVESFLGDVNYIAWHLPAAEAYAEDLLRLAPSASATTTDLRRWQDELFKLSVRVDADLLLGSRIIILCRNALDQQLGGHDKWSAPQKLVHRL